jgi:hypothetical protein
MTKEERLSFDKRKGAFLQQQLPANAYKNIRRTCNHKMGGGDLMSLLQGIGDDAELYAVSKVKLFTGDVMIRCNRCRKKWLPPLESEYTTKEALDAAWEEYNKALDFKNGLAMVITQQYRWQKAGKDLNRQYTHERFVPKETR